MNIEILEKINTDHSIIYILIRTVIIYSYSVLLLRFGSTRFMLKTPFDFILIIILGAVLGGGLYGGATLAATLVCSFLLISLHEIFANLSFKFKILRNLLKGKPQTLLKSGKMNISAMKKNNITEDDLIEVCRSKINKESLNRVKKAILEKNGEINLIL